MFHVGGGALSLLRGAGPPAMGQRVSFPVIPEKAEVTDGVSTFVRPILPRQGEVSPKVTEGEDTEQRFPFPPPPSGKSQPPPPCGGGSRAGYSPKCNIAPQIAPHPARHPSERWDLIMGQTPRATGGDPSFRWGDGWGEEACSGFTARSAGSRGNHDRRAVRSPSGSSSHAVRSRRTNCSRSAATSSSNPCRTGSARSRR